MDSSQELTGMLNYKRLTGDKTKWRQVWYQAMGFQGHWWWPWWWTPPKEYDDQVMYLNMSPTYVLQTFLLLSTISYALHSSCFCTPRFIPHKISSVWRLKIVFLQNVNWYVCVCLKSFPTYVSIKWFYLLHSCRFVDMEMSANDTLCWKYARVNNSDSKIWSHVLAVIISYQRGAFELLSIKQYWWTFINSN